MSTSAQDNKPRITADQIQTVRLAAERNMELILRTYGAKWTGKKLHCPWPDHADKNASASIKNGNIKCWSCGRSGDVFELVKAHENCTFPEAVRRVAEILGIHI